MCGQTELMIRKEIQRDINIGIHADWGDIILTILSKGGRGRELVFF